MLGVMDRRTGKKPTAKKAAKKVARKADTHVSTGTKGRPRTVRLPHDDDTWVDAQPHPQGFSGVISDAVRLYRENKDAQRKALLEAVS